MQITKKNYNQRYSLVRVTSWLVLFQILGLLIPLATLPLMARSLNVIVFGQVMLAQAIVSIGVTFVDAGFNTESQRRVAIASTVLEAHQALIDNIISRLIAGLPIIFLILLIAWFTPALPFNFILISLLMLLGTLIFPQWWYIARNEGFKMGVISTLGRLISAALIIVFVRLPNDAWIAVIAMSSATLISGLMLLPQLIQQLRRIQVDLSFHSWKQYLLDVRPIIFSSFFANASASVPVIVLGALGSAIQTGLYTASDRLTRAAAYLISFIEQALMVYIAKLNHTNSDSLSLIRMRILIAIAIIMSIVCTISIGLSGWFLNLLYGSAFYAGIPILQILIVWLFLYAIRKAGTTFFFIAIGKLATISYLQWAEAISVLFFCALGGYLYSAKGVAIALCGVEILLLILIIYKSRNKQIKDQL